MQYEFRNLDPVENNTSLDIASEGFIFNGYDTRLNGWFLVERNAPLPEEQEITEQVPYMQGEWDFSMFNGERFFKNRSITYKIVAFGRRYRNRSALENDLKRELTRVGESTLKDTHDPCYYWRGKCKSIEVEDDEDKHVLTATIEFNCYPFAFTNHVEGSDIWDDVDFDHWIWQDVEFDVNGSRNVTIQNIGSRPVISTFKVTGTIKVKGGAGEVEVNQSTGTITEYVMDMGSNRFTLTGNGRIKFVFTREELL